MLISWPGESSWVISPPDRFGSVSAGSAARASSNLKSLNPASLSFRQNSEMTALTGSYFTGHPPRCPVSLRFEPSPLTRGAMDFSQRDEH